MFITKVERDKQRTKPTRNVESMIKTFGHSAATHSILAVSVFFPHIPWPSQVGLYGNELVSLQIVLMIQSQFVCWLNP